MTVTDEDEPLICDPLKPDTCATDGSDQDDRALIKSKTENERFRPKPEM